MRPTFNEINLATLRYNLKQIETHIPDGGSLLAIVKANAYGHGAIAIAGELEKCGERYFGVATVGEALELRRHNINSSILILGAFYDGDLPDILWNRLTPVCYRMDHLEKLESAAKSAQTRIKVHIKFDTGMGRLGFEWQDAGKIADTLLVKTSLDFEGIMSHLASSEEETDYNDLQLKRFAEIRSIFDVKGLKPKFFHMSNSGAILRELNTGCNLFRPGLSLYGVYTSPKLKKHLDLKQLMNLRSVITQIKELEPGRSVSYNRKFITTRPSRVGIVPVGYADGYDYRLSNKGRVIVKNSWAKVLGSVCVDMVAIDITDIRDVNVGEEVTLIGCSGDKFISLNDLAMDIGTIPYEIMCSISERVIKKYIDT